MSYRIGSFNMYKLSFQSDGEIRKNFEKIADIIHTERFDIVAMQEVFTGNAVSLLLRYLGPHWEYRWIAPPQKSSGPTEGYAYIWNSRRIQLVTTVEYGAEKSIEPRLLRQYARLGNLELKHAPYYARFTPCGLVGGSFFEIRLINAHIRYKKGNDVSDLSEVRLRQGEFDILTRSIYPKVSDARDGNNMPAYTIILGDYNLNLNRDHTQAPYLTETVEIKEGRAYKRIVTVQEQLTTLKDTSKSTEGASSGGYANNYDHFTYDQARFDAVVKIGTQSIDAVEKYYGNDFEKYRKEVSDHIPIRMDLKLK